MNDILKRRGVRQFVKFGLVGLLSTVIDWGIYLIATRVFGAFYILAKIISFLFAVCNSYLWNRRWTFRSLETNKIGQFSKFFIVSGIGLGINALIMIYIVESLKMPDTYGLIIATLFVTTWNFAANKFWTFKEVKR